MNHRDRILTCGLDQAYRVPRIDFEETFPSRGQSLFEQLALARGGNRPEPVQSNEDVAREWAARNGFSVSMNFETREFTFVRMDCRCGYCGGRGQRAAPAYNNRLTPARASERSRVSITYSTCEKCHGMGRVLHPGDPDARVGDYSDSDAWIRARQYEREARDELEMRAR